MRLSVLVLVMALASSTAPGDTVGAACTCAAVERDNGWCTEHDLGYVAGVKITSEAVFEALDAHGHHVPRERLRCSRCLEAHDAGRGFCEEHEIGWVDGQAYLSALTYYLERGRGSEPDTVRCPVCEENASSHGWCDRCAVGRAGTFVFEDRVEFSKLERELAILNAANETALRCETCAVAMLLDGTCTACRISYEDGERVNAETP